MSEKPVVDIINNSNTECGFCEEGVAEREVDDYDPEFGASYTPINGSVLIVDKSKSVANHWVSHWLCKDCGLDEINIAVFVTNELCVVHRSEPNA